MAKMCWLLLLSLAIYHSTGASCIEDADDDEVCAFQLNRDFHKALTKDNSCACMGWSSAYKVLKNKDQVSIEPGGIKGGVWCGRGNELDMFGGLAGLWNYNKQFCTMYWSRLNDNTMCHKSKFDSSSDTWCYVSSNCTDTPTEDLEYASLGIKKNTGLKTKACGAGDRKLGDMKFEELAAYALENKLEMVMIVQYAYPTFDGAKLSEIHEFWDLPKAADSASPIPEELRSTLKAHVESGANMFITSRSGLPPFAVSEGNRLYWINYSDEFKEHVKNGDSMEDVAMNHTETMWAWRCVSGCEATSPVF